MILYQVTPPKRTRKAGFQEKGWHTIDGYKYEANQLSQCVSHAASSHFQKRFTGFISINITQDIEPETMKSAWTKICRKLKDQGVEALWIIEANRRNHFNFHLLTKSTHPNIKELIKAAFTAQHIKTNIKADPYHAGKGRYVLRYMTKAVTAKYEDGRLITRDRWKKKRLLFRPELKIRKYGTIGAFWETTSKDKCWAEIIAVERRIARGLEQPGAEQYCKEMYDLVDGHVSMNEIRRSVGYWGVPDHWIPQM